MPEAAKARTSSVRMRRIARAITAWREESGQDQATVARKVGWSGAKQSRMEAVKLPISPADVITLGLHFGRTPEEREALFTAAQTAQSSRWVDESSAEAFAEDVRDYVSLEAEADEVCIFKIDVVPGLFQTEDYVHAIEALSGERSEDRVQARIRRQARLRDKSPLRVRCVLTEAVLRLQVGGRETWLGQLRRFAELMELPNVDIRCLKSESGGYRAMGYPFNILRFDDGEQEIGYIEHLRTGVYLEETDETRPYIEAFDALWASAESPEASRVLLAEITKAAE